jgi:hypothetical protein
MTVGDDNARPDNPLHLLDGSIRDQLCPGCLGVVAARAGMGKSTMLVHIAVAELLEERPVLHVCLDHTVADVRGHYDRMFNEASLHGLMDGSDTHRMTLERRRHIHSYQRQGFSADKLDEALQFLGDVMDFSPRTVVIDGFPLEVASRKAVTKLRDVARASETRIWLAALTHRHEPIDPAVGVPKPVDEFADLFDLVLSLAPEGDRVLLRLLRAADQDAPKPLPLVLDPTTSLLTRQDCSQ